VLNAYAIEHAPETAAPERIAYAMDALLAWWQDSTIDAIRTEVCKRYRRERGVGDGTIRRELGVLRAAVRHAVRAGRLTAAPEFWMPPPPPARDRWLRRDEAAALLRAARASGKAKQHLPLFILIALYTGARKEAVLSLRWAQVDLVRGRIDFNPRGRQQTKKRRPIIPIPRRLAWFLTMEHARASSPFVIHRNGERLGDIKKAFKAACRRAGFEDVTPHTLRHTAGTWMAQQGVDLWQIGGYLGQDHERTTELYAHHHPDFLNDAKRAMD
jgi:integrase